MICCGFVVVNSPSIFVKQHSDIHNMHYDTDNLVRNRNAFVSWF